MMKYWLLCLSIPFVLLACSKDCNHSVQEQQEKWLESEPQSYAYTVRKSFFVTPDALGPYRFEIVDGQVDTIYFDLESFPIDTSFLFEGWDDYEKVKEYAVSFDMDALFAFIADHEGECSVIYDPTYHFPVEFDIPTDPEIPDSGYLIIVSDFEEL